MLPRTSDASCEIERWSGELAKLHFAAPVTHVYNPLEYAAVPYAEYMSRYGTGKKEAVFLGMNPGPWGMAQTGVPFGVVSLVRDWMGIIGSVGKPNHEHAQRRVEGFACRREEVSGLRLWGWAKSTFETPSRFFRRFFVANYCPLMFLECSGRNRTPDQLPAAEREPLLAVCDAALRRLVESLEPRCVVGVGKFAKQRARVALAEFDVRVIGILHPSPASPQANRGWAECAVRQLEEGGIRL